MMSAICYALYPQWFRNERDELPPNARVEHLMRFACLDIMEFNVSDRGHYECEGQTENNELFYGQVTFNYLG